MDTEIRTEISRKRIVRCKVVMTVLTAARARTVQDGPEQCLFQPPLSSTPDWNQYLHSSPCKPWINVGSADPSNPFSIESAHTYTVRVYSIHREKDFAWIGRGGGISLSFSLYTVASLFFEPTRNTRVSFRESRGGHWLCASKRFFTRLERGPWSLNEGYIYLSLSWQGGYLDVNEALNDDNMRIRVRYCCYVLDRTGRTRVKASLNWTVDNSQLD